MFICDCVMILTELCMVIKTMEFKHVYLISISKIIHKLGILNLHTGMRMNVDLHAHVFECFHNMYV